MSWQWKYDLDGITIRLYEDRNSTKAQANIINKDEYRLLNYLPNFP